MAWLVANAEMQILCGDCSVSRELSERFVECKFSGKAPPPLYCDKGGRYTWRRIRAVKLLEGFNTLWF